jgi:hypothetical protein
MDWALAVVSFLTALFKAFPVMQGWWNALVAAYIQKQADKFDKAVMDGIRKAIYEQDQRDLEKAIGNPNAGKPVPLPGSEIVDDLPGVPRLK